MSIKTIAEKIGHGFAVVFRSPVKLEEALQQTITAEPELKAGVIQLIKDVESAEGSVALCIPTAGAAVSLDLDAAAKLKTLFDDFRAFLPVAEKVYKEVEGDFTTEPVAPVAETAVQK